MRILDSFVTPPRDVMIAGWANRRRGTLIRDGKRSEQEETAP